MEITIDIKEFKWNLGKNQQPPKDRLIITMSPSGNVSVILGRELLGWTRWLTLDDFYMKAKSLIV
jgi:hypothetical protein